MGSQPQLMGLWIIVKYKSQQERAELSKLVMSRERVRAYLINPARKPAMEHSRFLPTSIHVTRV